MDLEKKEQGTPGRSSKSPGPCYPTINVNYCYSLYISEHKIIIASKTSLIKPRGGKMCKLYYFFLNSVQYF